MGGGMEQQEGHKSNFRELPVASTTTTTVTTLH